MGGDTETAGELGDRQRPGYVARVGLMALLHAAMLEPDGFDRTRQDLGPLRGAIALLREFGSGLIASSVCPAANRVRICCSIGGGPLQVGEGPRR